MKCSHFNHNKSFFQRKWSTLQAENYSFTFNFNLCWMLMRKSSTEEKNSSYELWTRVESLKKTALLTLQLEKALKKAAQRDCELCAFGIFCYGMNEFWFLKTISSERVSQRLCAALGLHETTESFIFTFLRHFIASYSQYQIVNLDFKFQRKWNFLSLFILYEKNMRS